MRVLTDRARLEAASLCTAKRLTRGCVLSARRLSGGQVAALESLTVEELNGGPQDSQLVVLIQQRQTAGRSHWLARCCPRRQCCRAWSAWVRTACGCCLSEHGE